MSPAVASITTVPLTDEVASFVYREARLIDEQRFEDWLRLWASECSYFAPANDFEKSPLKVALIRDDRDRLEERIYRLTHSGAHAQEPRSRTTHYLSNLELTGRDSDIAVEAASMIIEVRGESQEIYGGRTRYLLGRGDDGRLLIREKTVLLTRNQQMLGNLTFLL
jgi:3-phenylpropionate/cinnamic acid dioxygenase small subunit